MSTTKPKIFHLIGDLQIGGTEQMLLKTLPLLSRYEHQVCSIRSVGPIGAGLQKSGVSVTALHQPSFVSFGLVKQIRSQLLEFRPQILQTYLMQADLLGRWIGRSLGIPHIVSSIRATLHEKKFILPLLLDSATSPLVDIYLSNSKSGKNQFHSFGIPSKKIVVVPNGISIEIFHPRSDAENAALRAQFHLSPSSILIGCIAKFRPQKGHAVLLAAIPELVRRFPELHLLLIGSGPLEQKLHDQIHRLNIASHIHFFGNRSKENDIPQILSMLDLFILPTFYEGMSNAVLEALATGCPVITTNIPENREIMENGVHGLLIPTKNTNAIVDRVSILLRDPEQARRLATFGVQRIKECYTLDKTVQQLDRFYQDLLSKHSQSTS